MNHLIQLTALPRSGTAFASMLFQLHPDVIAYHELATYDKQWRRTILSNQADVVADCSTYGFLPDAEMEVPYDVERHHVFLHRPLEESHRAAEIATKKEIDAEFYDFLGREAVKWVHKHLALVMKKGEIFTVDGCIKLWGYCFTEPPPVDKIRELIKLNIQHKDPHIKFGKTAKFEL